MRFLQIFILITFSFSTKKKHATNKSDMFLQQKLHSYVNENFSNKMYFFLRI